MPGVAAETERSAIVVTAADAAYFRCPLQLLRSIDRHDPGRTLRTLVYDLGLRAAQRRALVAHFPRVELRDAGLASMPDFMRIRERALNTNAWKPQLIEAVLAEADGPLLWLDSACVLLCHPTRLIAEATSSGIYAPFGSHSSIARWTHPSTAAYFGLSATDLRQRMRASGVVGIDPRHPVARPLIARWAEACRDVRCVSPEGALREALATRAITPRW